MSAPRLTPAGLSQLGLINWVIWRVLSKIAGTADAHLFSALGRQRKLFRAWLRFSAQLMPGGLIRKHETELVILRVAHLRQCQYELDHHVRIGRRFGVTAELVERVFVGPTAPAWSDRHRALLTAVDALVRDKNVDDPTWATLRAHYSEAQCVELCLLVGQYEMLATTIHTLHIQRDF
jgi:AhpD family alkylhydroperoxidase